MLDGARDSRACSRPSGDLRYGRNNRHVWQRWRTRWRNRYSRPEGAEVDLARVCRQKVVQSLVVGVRHAEQSQQRPISSFGLRQPATDQLAEVMPCEIAFEEHRVNMIPERVMALDQHVVELVRDLASTFSPWRGSRIDG